MHRQQRTDGAGFRYGTASLTRTVANWHQPVELNNFGRQQAKATASEQNRQRQFGPCPKNGSLHRLGRYL